MRVALHAQAPVLLVGDIDRGGVFAHLYGTIGLLRPEERALVQGFVINKFRGDRRLLEPGLEMIRALTGTPVLGVVPYLRGLRIADEDAVALDERRAQAGGAGLDIVVVRLPRIANFDDFDPLAAEPDVRLRYIERAADLGAPDLIILPGTKSTIADLAWLRATGLADRVVAAVRAGTPIIGVCGGYQMLGVEVRDPGHVESEEDRVPGLGLLPVVTDFEPVKATHQVVGSVVAATGLLEGCTDATVRGYEIHMGQSHPLPGALPAPFRLALRSGTVCDHPDGALDESGQVVGTYLHGLFDNHALRAAILGNLAQAKGVRFTPGLPLDRAAEYDRLADCLRDELDMHAIRTLTGLEQPVWTA
jgi:adenosylcobyric acid synthase